MGLYQCSKTEGTTKEKHNGKSDLVLCSIIYDTAVASKQLLRIIQQNISLTITMELAFIRSQNTNAAAMIITLDNYMRDDKW